MPTPKLAIAIVKKIASALQSFHDAESIHQDLKPGNILVDEQLNLKVIDFTGQIPYGDKIDHCFSSFDFEKRRCRSAMEFNLHIPLWFDRALQKGVSLDLSVRYRRLQDFINDICQPNPDFLLDDPKVSNSRGLFFWQLMSGFWILTLVIVVLLFSTSG